MGIVYGVDVRDGAGVRPSTADYDDNGGYTPANTSGVYSPQLPVSTTEAFEGIVNAQLPLLVGEAAGEYPPAVAVPVVALTLLTVEELTLSLTVDLVFLVPEAINVITSIDAAVTLDPSVVADERVVPLETTAFTIPDWFAVSGMPQATTGLVVQSQATASVGSLRPLPIYPDPRDVLIPASLRWIPEYYTLNPLATEWSPYSKTSPTSLGMSVWELGQKTVLQAQAYTVDDIAYSEFIVLPNSRNYVYSEPGVNPTLLGEYTYWRGGDYVRNPALAFRGGDHMWCDAINWNANQLTVIAVAVLHRPDNGWYGLLETQGPNTDGLDPFFGLRYESSGGVVLWADSALLRIPLDTGESRPAQPVIFGFSIDMVNNTCTLLSVDQVAKVQTTALPHRYDNRSRLWVGRSPHGEQAAANMDLLELGVFDYSMPSGELAHMLGLYDRMYGVSAS